MATLASPTAKATSTTAATASVHADTSGGTLYWLITAKRTAPSGQQVKDGKDHTGASALFSGSQSVTSSGKQTISPSGLSARTAYYVHLYHEVSGTVFSEVVTYGFGTPPEAPPPRSRGLDWYVHCGLKEGEPTILRDFTERCWRQTNVHPLLSVFIQSPEDVNDSPPDCGPFNNSPAGAGDMVGCSIAWVHNRMLGNHLDSAGAGRGVIKWSFWGNGFGLSTTTMQDQDPPIQPLLQSPSDALPDGHGLTETQRVGSFYTEQGIVDNQEFSDEWLATVEAQLQAETPRIPPPAILDTDLEQKFTHEPANNYNALHLVMVDEDPRYETEHLRNGTNNTLEDIFDNERPADFDGGMSYWDPDNEFTTWLHANLRWELMDYALGKALYERARAVWPQINCGNYDILPATEEAWSPDSGQQWKRSRTDITIRAGDHAAPVLFGVRRDDYDLFKDKWWDEVFKRTPTGDDDVDYQLFLLMWAFQKLEAAFSQGIPVYPWVWLGETNPRMSFATTVRVCQRARLMGAAGIKLFANDLPQPEQKADPTRLIAAVDNVPTHRRRRRFGARRSPDRRVGSRR